MVSAVWWETEFTPALLRRKSIFLLERVEARALVKEEMEALEPVSQTRMWVVFEAADCRSKVSVASERMQAMMVLEVSWASWRTNSRPRPRLAPVMQ